MAETDILQDEQIRKAVNALLKHVSKQNSKSNDLLEEDELLYLVCCSTHIYFIAVTTVMVDRHISVAICVWSLQSKPRLACLGLHLVFISPNWCILPLHRS